MDYSINNYPNPPCSHVSLFELKEQKINTTVFPNPFDQNINISINLQKETPIIVNLYDINGRLILSKDFNVYIGEQILNLQTDFISKGTYFIHITSKNNKFLSSSKLIKL